MLTRLEVSGFKNLVGFSINFGPFTCIAGLNGVGKSNIFDAIKFLSLLSDNSIYEAALGVRDMTSSDPEDIFWTDGDERASSLNIAAEMIVDPFVIDDFGRSSKVTSTFLRYEIELGFSEGEGIGERPFIYLVSERLKYINKGEAARKLGFPSSARFFRDKILINKRKNADFISTNCAQDNVVEIHLHQDGGSSGHPQKIPAKQIPKTVVANTNSAVWPTVLAARREMQSWRFLFLEPSAMRRSNKLHEPQEVDASGGCLAGALYRLYRRDSNVYSRIASRLSEMLPVSDVRVDVDETRQLLTVEVKERSGAFLPARSLSDGTLRFLSLCIMAEDPDYKGLLCFEEPENGIHPARMEAMLQLLKDLSVDPNEEVGEDNPMRQMIIATHSPVMVSLQDKADLVYADVVKVKGPNGRPTSTLRCRSLKGSWRSEVMDGSDMDIGSIIAYLEYPIGAQIKLI